jgi:serine/threonine-protein kinase
VVPAVKPGTAVAAAEQALRDAGLTASSGRQEYSPSVPSGAVVRTDPPAGTALPAGSAVALVTSRGPEPRRQVRVPFLIGRTTASATAMLRALGLDPEVESAFPFGPVDGNSHVVSQDHGAGSLVDPGTTITLRTL